MSPVHARAQVVADGYATWEDGILDRESGHFAYLGFRRCVRVHRIAVPAGTDTLLPGWDTYTKVTTIEGAVLT